jgi:hypothetical protein
MHLFLVDFCIFLFPVSPKRVMIGQNGGGGAGLPPHRARPFFHAQNAPFLQIEIAVFLRIGVFFTILRFCSKSLQKALTGPLLRDTMNT